MSSRAAGKKGGNFASQRRGSLPKAKELPVAIDIPLAHDIPCKLLTERLSYAPSILVSGPTSKFETLAFKFEESCAAREVLFGPVDVFAYREFSKRLSEELDDSAKEKVHFVYCSRREDLFVDNAVFLLAAYMVLKLKWSSRNSLRPFLVFEDGKRLMFRHTSDGQFADGNLGMELSVKDCICGVEKAQKQGWFVEVLANEAVALDLRQVCNKFVSIPSSTSEFQRNQDLKNSDVTMFIRASKGSQIDESELKTKGVQLLSFCGKPVLSDLDVFCEMCETQRGVAFEESLAKELPALLISAWLVKRHGFTSSEAIGFFLFLFPGSILGRQERILKRFEGTLTPISPLASPKTRLSSDATRLSSGVPSPSSDVVRRRSSGSVELVRRNSDDFSRASTFDRLLSQESAASSSGHAAHSLPSHKHGEEETNVKNLCQEMFAGLEVRIPKSGVQNTTPNLLFSLLSLQKSTAEEDMDILPPRKVLQSTISCHDWFDLLSATPVS